MRTLLTLILAFAAMTQMTHASEADRSPDSALDFKMETIDGKAVDLKDYQGKVVLIVNVASECGLTPQYAGLQELYEAHKDKGLVVLGFPCNQFGSQEPGSDSEIKQFCTSKYGVSFPMFSKIQVNGEDAAPLYKYLTAQNVEPVGDGKISWNFEKFLIDRDGQLVHRFSPRTGPSDPSLTKAIESELAASN